MNRSRSPLAIFVALAAVLIASATFATPGSAGSKPKKAPEFAVKDLDGKTVKLSDYDGKGVVLEFWATWCVPCRASMPHLSELQKRYEKDGLVVLGLSVDELSPKTVKRFAKNLDVQYPLAMADDKVLFQYGPIRVLPTTIFIDKKGKIDRRVVGYVDPETVETYVRETLGLGSESAAK